MEVLRSALRDLPLSRIVTSPLRRASETASLLAAGRSARIETVEALREIHLGTWENRTFDDVAAAASIGVKTTIVENLSPNPKITVPEDIAFIEFLKKGKK